MTTDHEDDILIPRRLHSYAKGDDPNGNPAGFSIDPAMLERRNKRKLAFHPQPSNGSATETLLEHIDRIVAARNSVFKEPMWTLGDVARWVVKRTPAAVDGLSIDEERLPEALAEIHDALAREQIEAWSATTLEPMHRKLPAATWSSYAFAFEEINGLLHTYTIHTSTYERPFKDLRFKSIEVRGHWQGTEPIPQPTTAGAQTECRRWLSSEMSNSPDRPRPKDQVWVEAKKRFPKLSKRGFERAWSDAICKTGSHKWSKSGPRSG
jgi:hypothetical protein